MLNQTTKTRKSQQARELTIVAIYKFKTNGKLNGTRCTLVRNDKSEQLKVWTHTNGCASSCTCEGFEKSHGRRKCYHIKFVEAIEAASYDMRRCNSITRKVVQPVVETAATETSLLEQVNEKLANVGAELATAEEVAATAKQCLVLNADQVSYFLQISRRAKALKPVPTPETRKVSPDWLLGHRNGGTFSGKVA